MSTPENLVTLREKVRGLKQECQRRFVNLDEQLARLGDSLDRHDQCLLDLETRLEELTARLEKPDDPMAGEPVAVNDLASLRAFIAARFGETALTAFQPSGLKAACMAIRNALAATFGDIERLNDQQERHGYTASETKHADAIYWFDGAAWRIVDFCIASDAPGVLDAQLCWRIEPRTPWEGN